MGVVIRSKLRVLALYGVIQEVTTSIGASPGVLTSDVHVGKTLRRPFSGIDDA